MTDRLSISIIGRNEIGCQGLSHILSIRGAVVERCVFNDREIDFETWTDEASHVIVVESASVTEALQKHGDLRAAMPKSRIVLLCDTYDLDTIGEAFASGMDGVIPTWIAAQAFYCAVEMASLGEKVMPSELADMLAAQGATIINQGTRRQFPCLSTKELEVLQCLVTGDANKRIADRLALTDTMVKVHIRAILRKLNVRNRTQAAIWAVGHALPPDKNNDVLN